jgi:K(+)-stimulated pyrophosphate-energized sodium pump
MDYTILAPIAGVLALVFAGYLAYSVMKENAGTERMRQISSAVQEGAMAYLNRQYKTIFIIAIIIALAMIAAGVLTNDLTAWLWVMGGFIVGAVLSAVAGYIGMNISVRSNVRTAEAAKTGLAKAFDVAFKGGAVTGFAVVGLGLLGISIMYLLAVNVYAPGKAVDMATMRPLIGLGFGASLLSLFARVGGGIFTKAADVGADLVGKVEAGIPEDDPRNPAVIADNVGDNVGDCAGMGADLFETYIVTALAAILLGSISSTWIKPAYNLSATAVSNLVTYPLLLGAAAIIACIVAVFFVKLGKDNKIMKALYIGIIVSTIVAAALFYTVNYVMMDGNINLFIASLVGLGVMAALVIITEYYTGTAHRPVKDVAKSSQTGAGTNIITGLAVGFEATALPVLVIVIGIVIAYYLCGVYGIAIAAVAMLSVTGIIVAVDSFGPITDNAGGIAEMAELPPEVRKSTDALDAVGNTTKAVTKGYAIGSAALAALALFAALKADITTPNLNLSIDNPVVLVGLFIGGMLPFLFSAFCMQAVGRAAFSIVNEVRRQFKEIPGIMENKAKPDYAKCVDIVTKAALNQMTLPAVMAVLAPLVVGFLLGPAALSGMLLGVIVTGLLLAIHMTSGGAAWDNGKKFIELGNYGGKKSDAHKAAVVGDTVGDPYKDTAGPALNALIKVMNTISLIFIGLICANFLFVI